MLCTVYIPWMFIESQSKAILYVERSTEQIRTCVLFSKFSNHNIIIADNRPDFRPTIVKNNPNSDHCGSKIIP